MVFAPGFKRPSNSSPLVVAFRSSTVSNGSTIAIPSGCVAGDLLVLLDVANASTSTIPSSVTPSGFTNLANLGVTGTTSMRAALWYRLATGSETTLTGLNGTGDNSKVLLCFSGGISSVAPSTVNNQGTTGNPSNQTVIASSGTPPLIVIGAFGASGSVVTASRAMSPAGTYLEPASGDNASLGYKIYASAPANNTVSMGDTGRTNALISCYIECS